MVEGISSKYNDFNFIVSDNGIEVMNGLDLNCESCKIKPLQNISLREEYMNTTVFGKWELIISDTDLSQDDGLLSTINYLLRFKC